jgi:branched-chain amino acid transport system permease protein
MTFEIVFQTFLNSLLYGSILSLSSFAIILIFKTSTTTNFAQGTISVVGAFIAAFMFSRHNVPLIIGLPVGMIVSFLIGLFIDTQIFRRSRFLTPVGKQMITMGLVLFITGLLPVIFGDVPLYVSKIMEGNLLFTLFGKSFVMTYHAFLSTIVSIVIIAALFIALKFTKWGLGVRATASSEKVAGLMGVNTRVITAMSWSIAGGLGALAAIFYAGANTGSVEVSFMTNVQVNGFLSTILGGFSTFGGPILGSWLITIATNLIGYQYSVWKDVIVYSLILLTILFLPRGLFGKKVIKKV